MPCHTRMKLLLRGLLWLFLLEFGFMVTSLEPGFLDFDNLPDTNFSCVGKVIGGYYADLETSCQMFHVCTIGQLDEPMDIRFLCLNGTVFDQETRVCERIDEVDCSKSEQFYSLNLELYGNTQPPILEETPETEEPPLSSFNSKKTTTTTTTTSRPIQPKTTRPSYIITASNSKAPLTTTPAPPIPQPPKPAHPKPQIHFASNSQHQQSTDIRFNPEEYKISLNPNGVPSPNANGAKPISFQTFSDNNKRVIVTTHTTIYKSEKQPLLTVTASSTSAKDHEHDIKDDYDSEISDSTEDSYSYGYHDESLKTITKKPSYQQAYQNFRPNLEQSYKPSTYRSVFHPATNNPLKLYHRPSTYRNFQQHYQLPRSEKPSLNRVQIPILPTLSPLQFSSPAPFSLNRHVETKRFIDHRQQLQQFQQLQHQQPPKLHTQLVQQTQQSQVHHQPPRIVISASASVSDASGRKFNYSLGTIGDTRLFGQPAPHSYDDYKEGDVVLDPFYHDVPKLIRHKRQVDEGAGLPVAQTPGENESNSTEGEKEAIDVLRFLFNWYNNHEKAPDMKYGALGPIKAETITEINDELTPSAHGQNGNLFYDEFDLNVNLNKEQAEELQAQTRRDFEKPYLSLQLLKPPVFDSPATENLQQQNQQQQQRFEEIRQETAITTVAPSVRTTTMTPIPMTTSTTTTERNFYYDYVNDNYEPLAYQQQYQGQQQGQQQEIAHNKQNDNRKDVEYYKQIDNYSVPDEYVDDNYEPITYDHSRGQQQQQQEQEQQQIQEQQLRKEPDISSRVTTQATVTTLKLPQKEYDYLQPNLHVGRQQQQQEQEKVSRVTTRPILTTLQVSPEEYDFQQQNLQVARQQQQLRQEQQRLQQEQQKQENGPRVTTQPILTTLKVPLKEYDYLLPNLPVTRQQQQQQLQQERQLQLEQQEKQKGSRVTTQPILTTLQVSQEEYDFQQQNLQVARQQQLQLQKERQLQLEQQEKQKGSRVTTQPILTTLKVPRKEFDYEQPNLPLASYDYDYNYNYKENASPSPSLTTSTTPTTTTTTVATTTTTEDYNQVLGILGITTRQPQQQQQYNDNSRPNILGGRGRGRSRGKTRFTLRDFDIPADVTRKSSTTTTFRPFTQKTKQESVESVTDNLFQYTLNVNRRTNEQEQVQQEHEQEVAYYEQTTFRNDHEDVLTSTTTTPSLVDVNMTSTPVGEVELESTYAKLGETTPSSIETTTTVKQSHFTTPEVVPLETLVAQVEATTKSLAVHENTDFNLTTTVRQEAPEVTTVKVPTTLVTNGNFEVTTDYTTLGFEATDLTTAPTVPTVTIAETQTVTPRSIWSLTFSTPPLGFGTRIPLQESTHAVDLTTTATALPEISTAFQPTVTEFPDIVTTFPVPVTVASTTVLPSLSETRDRNPSRRRSKSRFRVVSTSPSPSTTTATTSTTTNIPTRTRIPSLNEQIVDVIKHKMASESPQSKSKIEFNINAYTANLAYRHSPAPSLQSHLSQLSQLSEVQSHMSLPTVATFDLEEAPLTEQPISKSAKPTNADYLPTTPISKSTAINVHKQVKQHNNHNNMYTFNCFDKEINRFYSDPRDCRLFHYCTRGFTRTQLLDMKFVCDLGTFFDEDKLVCTRARPQRCLL